MHGTGIEKEVEICATNLANRTKCMSTNAILHVFTNFFPVSVHWCLVPPCQLLFRQMLSFFCYHLGDGTIVCLWHKYQGDRPRPNLQIEERCVEQAKTTTAEMLRSRVATAAHLEINVLTENVF
jgi:hypothetical protein